MPDEPATSIYIDAADAITHEVEKQAAAVRAICDLETNRLLTSLRLLRSYFSQEQLQTRLLEYFLQVMDMLPSGTRPRTKGFQDALQTPGATGHRMSIGLTPKTLRLPKKGEMLISVRGSPLGVFKEKEDNIEAIKEES